MSVPGGTHTVAGGICTTCPRGTIEVIVWKHAICWDTPADGEDAADPRFDGAIVSVNTPEPYEIRSGADGIPGKAVFRNLLPATYTVTARAPGYDDVTSDVQAYRGSQVVLTNTVTVEEDGRSCCDLVLRAKAARYNENGTWDTGRECLRRHVRPRPAQRGLLNALAPILWHDEPSWLIARDIAWLATGMAALLAVIIVLFAPGMAGLSFAAIAAAFFGYLGAVIFGEGFGRPAIAIAAAAFAVLLVVNMIMAALGGPADAYGMGILGGIWGSFGICYLPGRHDTWRQDENPFLGLARTFIWVPALLGAVLAGLLDGVILIAQHLGPGHTDLSFGLVVLVMVFGALLGALSGWAGFAFANEGRTQMPWGTTDCTLPYDGERYCLQGARGYWTHYANEEGAYDWSMPVGTNVLCAKEGHIVARYEDLTDIDAHGTANYIGVRHPDGSIARYAYSDTAPAANATADIETIEDTRQRRLERVRRRLQQLVSNQGWRFEGMSVAPSRDDNPLHVRAGNVLAISGRPYEPSADRSYMWVFWVGLVFAVLTVGGAFLLGGTVWLDWPPSDTLLVNYPGSKLAGLFRAADTSYSPAARSDAASRSEASRVAEIDADARKFRECPYPDRFDLSYCECLYRGPVKQWACTISAAIGFPVLGLIILYGFARTGPDRRPYPNRMTTMTNYTLTFGLVAIFMGPGSMLYHMSFYASGGMGDGLSMYLFMGFWVAYDIVRWKDLQAGWFYVLFTAIVVVSVLVNYVMILDRNTEGWTLLIMVFWGLVGALFELFLLPRSNVRPAAHDDANYWKSFFFFVGAFAFWFLSWTDPPFFPKGTVNILCHPGWPVFSPSSWWLEGHAIWHLLSAFGVFFMYYYFRDQTQPEPCATGFPRLHFTVSEAPPPGPGVDADAPVLSPGDRLPEIKYKPVKFSDSSLSSDEARPWSMRKYFSANQNLGITPIFEDRAYLDPRGGEHTPSTDGPERTRADARLDPDPAGIEAGAAPNPSLPGMPSRPTMAGLPSGLPPGAALSGDV